MTAKLTEQYDYDWRDFTRCRFEDDEYGFSGEYIHKDLGLCEVCVSQTFDEQYYLQLSIHVDGRQYNRQFNCSELPSHRLAAKKAKEFLGEIMV